MSAAAIASVVGPIVAQALSNKAKADELTNGISQAAASVVISEAQGESWLQRNWRPLMMMWFALLIGAYWFGIVPINMPIEIVGRMFDLVTLGIGGYVAGRSVEKIVKEVAPVIKRK